jgi:EmrB/QacA subfamily drug resistance transporter
VFCTLGYMSRGPSSIRARIEASPNYRRWVLVVALTGMFATTFPVTILTVSLGDIAIELDTSETVLAWVIAAPMLASAVVLPILGKMGDLYGQRRVFITGFALATLIAGLTALAWNAASLIGFRTLAQVIGAATQPTSMALVMGVFPPAERAKAMGYWTLVTTAGPAVGLIVGGPLVEAVGWQSIFIMQAAFGVLVLAASTLVLKEMPRREGVRFDVKGAGALAVSAGAIMVLLSQGTEWGFMHPALLVCAVLAPFALFAFVRIEQRVDAPLLPLGYFRRRNFTAPIVANVFLGAAYMGGFVLTPLLMRFVLEYSLAETAFVMILRPLTFSLSSPLGGHLATRIGECASATAGTAMMTIALALFAVGAMWASLPLVIGGLVLQGVGNGVGRPSLTSTLANAVDDRDLGVATASSRMIHQIGASFGIAVLTSIYGGTGMAGGFARAYIAGALLAAGSLVAATFLRSQPRGEPTETTDDETPTVDSADSVDPGLGDHVVPGPLLGIPGRPEEAEEEREPGDDSHGSTPGRLPGVERSAVRARDADSEQALSNRLAVPVGDQQPVVEELDGQPSDERNREGEERRRNEQHQGVDEPRR